MGWHACVKGKKKYGGLLVAFGSPPHTGIPPCMQRMHTIGSSNCIDCVECVLQCVSGPISFIFVFAVLVASQGAPAQTRIRPSEAYSQRFVRISTRIGAVWGRETRWRAKVAKN